MRIKLRDFQVQQATRLRNEASKKVEKAEEEVLTHSQHLECLNRTRWRLIFGGSAALLVAIVIFDCIWWKLIIKCTGGALLLVLAAFRDSVAYGT